MHIQEQLGGIPYTGNGIKGMASPKQREIGYRIQTEQIGAGNPEKVSHHQIRIPHGLKRRQTVKDIKSVSAFLRDPVINLHCKRLKTLIRIKLIDLEPFSWSQQRLVLCKPHINQISPVRDRLGDKRLCKKAEFLQFCHLPYHVVSHADGIQKVIHLRDPAENFIKCAHSLKPPILKRQGGLEGSSAPASKKGAVQVSQKRLKQRLCRNLCYFYQYSILFHLCPAFFLRNCLSLLSSCTLFLIIMIQEMMPHAILFVCDHCI